MSWIIHCEKHRHVKMALLGSSLTVMELMDPGEIWFKNRRWEPVKGEGTDFVLTAPVDAAAEGMQ